MTIYDVVLTFFNEMFPESVQLEYANIIEVLSFYVTLHIVFALILLPLYRIAMYFIKVGKRR